MYIIYLEVYLWNELDCKKEDEIREFCSKTANAEKIIEYISLRKGKQINEKTLLIFDEVQECPNIISSLKYFCLVCFHIKAVSMPPRLCRAKEIIPYREYSLKTLSLMNWLPKSINCFIGVARLLLSLNLLLSRTINCTRLTSKKAEGHLTHWKNSQIIISLNMPSRYQRIITDIILSRNCSRYRFTLSRL